MNTTVKAGLAYERVLGVNADSQLGGMAIGSLSLQGNTAIGELRMRLKPSTKNPWMLGVSTKGYVGDRSGFAGNVKAVFSY